MDVSEKIFNILFLTSVLYPLLIRNLVLCSEVSRPRGVPLSRASLYNPQNNFTCFDNSRTIPFSQVNDDYCDCLDASDEPGTSACYHGVFHCTNAGYKPMNIGSSRVNDGICDCCDGKDEYDSSVKCINNCVELGQFAREEALQREELLKAGKQLREEFSQKGIQAKQQKKEKLLGVEKNKEEAERVKAEKETLKNEAEKLENEALEYYRQLEEEENKQKAEIVAKKEKAEASITFQKYDANQDGKVSYVELQAYQTFDKDKDKQVSDEEAKYFLGGNDEVDLETFVNDAWAVIKPYLMIEAGAFKQTPDVDHPGTVSEVDGSENEEEQDKKEEDVNTEDEEDDEPEPETEVKEEESQSSREYDEETQRLVDAANEARAEYSNIEGAIKDLDSEIKDIKEYLQKDFGVDEEYAPLVGECFDFTDHEYIYKLCPFDRTVQAPKYGSVETRLGSWGKWSGPDHNKYESMLYDRGQACWNGPQRSTSVIISCGSENRITSVSEPNKCEYVFEFVTPAACTEYVVEGGDRGHDEL